MMSMAVLSNCTQYNYVLAVLDVFLSETPTGIAVLKHLKEILGEENVFKNIQLVKLTYLISHRITLRMK